MSKEEEEKIISSLLYIKMDKEQLRKATLEFTLNTFKIGCDHMNYSILSMLPTNIESIMKKFNLTKMPANRRVNELIKVGLVNRKKGTGEVLPTDLTLKFTKVIEKISEGLKEEVPRLLFTHH